MKQAHKVFSMVLSFFVINTALIFSAEWILRKTSPCFFCNTVRQFKYDQELGAVAKPNLNFHILTDHIIEVITNDVGSRNFADKTTLLDYKHTIFCTGDSYTEGVGNLNDESYPFYLDLLLNQVGEGYHKNFAVLNLGLGAYGSIQSAKIVRKYSELLNRPPDIIIYLICNNDFDDDNEFLSGGKHGYLVEGTPRFPAWMVRLNEYFERSQLYLRAKQIRREIRDRINVKHTWPVPAQKDLTVDNLEIFLPGLPELRELAHKYRSKLILSYTEYDQPIYEVVRNYAVKNGLGFVDYKSAVLETQTVLPSLPTHHTHSGGHFRSWVNLCIARKSAELVDSIQRDSPDD